MDDFLFNLDDLRQELLKTKERIQHQDIEIEMWRNRYLKSLDFNTGSKVWTAFLFASSKHMMDRMPEQFIKDILDHHENKSS